MKKKVAMCLCLGMVIGLMTGATAQADDEVKLTFWKSPHSDREDEIWASMIAEFNKEYPNISVVGFCSREGDCRICSRQRTGYQLSDRTVSVVREKWIFNGIR